MRKRLWAALALALLLALAGCGERTEEGGPVAMVRGKDFCIRQTDGSYEPVFLDGVNLGTAKPGYFPGEFAVTEEEYLRWFRQIHDMNVRTLRVYVTQNPAFYEALERFNRREEEPLWLIQGVYLNEELMARLGDALGDGGALREDFLADVRAAVDALHGNIDVAPEPGNPGGRYRADVSRWTIGWILGVEFSGEFVAATNENHPEEGSFTGTYVYTEGASPFEAFLASAAEEAVAYEMETYAAQRPVALCNWCTTDPLDHPGEPDPKEDWAAVDPEHIRATEAFQAGFFASYHVYPYYPDFFSFESALTAGGDPYGAYLEKLNAHHGMPVLVSEYGIPASRGTAHENQVTGMAQGHASEEDQGLWLRELNRSIRSSGCMGGLIFAWQDEWFKRCWNSMDYEDPDRRPYWLNVESPESCFGLLAFDPGEEPAVRLDGDSSEWRKKDLLVEQDGLRLSARHDGAYLYLLIEGDFDFEGDTLYLPLDVLGGQGNTHFEDTTFSHGAEYLLCLRGREESTLMVDAYYDVFQYDYSVRLDAFPALPGQEEVDSGCFNRIYLAMNRSHVLPETGETTAFQRFDTGALRYGNGDPESGDYDSLADLCGSGGTVEVRVPWMLLGFRDPSRLQVTGDFHETGDYVGVPTEGVRAGLCRPGGEAQMALYTWEGWDLPETRERLKGSYYILREYFGEER